MLKKSILFILLVSSLMFSCFLGSQSVKDKDNNYESAPSFQLTDLNGNTLDSKDFYGKVILVNFWATWCGPCRAEIPDLIEAYTELEKDGHIILGLAVSDNERTVRQFVEKNRINYPIAMATKKIIKAFQPGQYIPTTIIIDARGKLRKRYVGVLNKKEILEFLNDFKN